MRVTKRRLDRLVTPVLLLLLLGLLGLVATGARQRSRDLAGEEMHAALLHQADLRVHALENYFERARAVNRVLAENTAFRDYYDFDGADQRPDADDVDLAIEIHSDGARHVHGAAAPHVERLADINAALAQLQEVFPGAIGEACYIDVRGWETARVVRGDLAVGEELSSDETGAPFFAPTAGSEPAEVVQARPYVSPDTGEWVISNSTLVFGETGPVAMVHFEVTVESFRAEAADDAAFRTLVVDADDGAVVIDSDLPQELGAELGNPDHPGFQDLPTGVSAELRTDSESVVALQRVPDGGLNANNWVVAVVADADGGFGLAFGHRELLLTLVALLVSTVVLRRMRQGHNRLRQAAATDSLTGLLNRRAFTTELEQLLDRPTVALMIDLNGFKEINDALGHDVGDRILQEVAGRLRSQTRDGDLVCRMGGDEFAVCTPGSLTHGLGVAERLSEAIAQPMAVQGTRLRVTASIGLAARAAGEDHEEASLLRRADLAMYHAKRRGLPVAEFEPMQDPRSPEQLALGTDLRAALRDRAIDVHLQPQVDVASGAPVCLEALARWRHPGRGVVPPDEFIPVAEDLGVIGDLTVLVLDQALSAARRLRDSGHEIPVAVNISPLSLFDPDFAERIAVQLRAHDLGPEVLRLELTEGLLVGDSEEELASLRRLQALGLQIAVDDFGTGHSSLAYLSRLPVDELKIDRTFTMGLSEDPSNAFILRSTVDLGHNLGLRVVAEGVEDAEMMAVLAEVGCDVAQGYHIARPMPIEQAIEWVCCQVVRDFAG